MTLILVDVNNFVKNRVTAKSGVLFSYTNKHSSPYSRIVMHIQ